MVSSCKNKKSQTAYYLLQDTSTVVAKRDSKFYLSNFTVSVEGDSFQLAFTNNKAFDVFISKTNDSVLCRSTTKLGCHRFFFHYAYF